MNTDAKAKSSGLRREAPVGQMIVGAGVGRVVSFLASRIAQSNCRINCESKCDLHKGFSTVAACGLDAVLPKSMPKSTWRAKCAVRLRANRGLAWFLAPQATRFSAFHQVVIFSFL